MNAPDYNYNLPKQIQDIVEEIEQIHKDRILSISPLSENIEKCEFEFDDAIKAQLRGLGYL